MEYDKIKQLMEDMGNSKITSIDIDFPDGTKIKMKKEVNTVPQSIEVVQMPKIENKEETTKEIKIKEEGKLITSPMVGTFYQKPNPDADPYVELGQKVKKGDVLCIIEAMKLMNEIESEFNGEIKEILVKDGQPVEYGTPLFRIV